MLYSPQITLAAEYIRKDVSKEYVPAEEADKAEQAGPAEKWSLRTFMSRLHPYCQTSTSYTDNVYTSKKGFQKEEVSSQASPGVRFSLGRGLTVFGAKVNELSFDVGADENYLWYTDMRQDNLHGNISTGIKIGKHQIGVSDRFVKTHVQTSSVHITGDEGWLQNMTNDGSFSWAYMRKRFGIQFGYKIFTSWYENIHKQGNTRDQTFTITGLFNPPQMPKTSFFVSYDHGFVEYPLAGTRGGNGVYRRIWTGVKGKLAKKVTGNVGLGYELRDYKSGTDNRGEAVSVSLDYAHSSRTDFSLGLSRQVQESFYRAAASNNKTTTLSLSCTHTPFRKVTISPAISYSQAKYTDNKEMRVLGLGSAITYQFRPWLNLRFNYAHSQTRSTLTHNSKVNAYTVGGTLTF